MPIKSSENQNKGQKIIEDGGSFGGVRMGFNVAIVIDFKSLALL